MSKQQAPVASGDVPVSRSPSLLTILLAIAVIGGGVGFAAAAWLQKDPAKSTAAAQPAAAKPAATIGDGVIGPQDMAWIPGGEFLMGSDHRTTIPSCR